MAAFLKQFGTLIAGRMAESNRAGFIVKAGRFWYISSGTAILLLWYSAYRNERVAPGTISLPFPLVNSLKRSNPPDREEKELEHSLPHHEWATSKQGKKGGPAKPPTNSGLPMTAKEALQYQGLGAYEGKQVAGWIIPFLNYAKLNGWRGTLTSGFRTLQEERAIWNSGIRPAAKPGTSNHGKKNFPGGAVDVTEAKQLAEILNGIVGGSLLQWAGAKDPVHFSHPHNGAY